MAQAQIKFGTDGWRGYIAADFTFDNVCLAGSAIRRYLAETGQGDKPLLIGHDRRFGAEIYAAHVAAHLRAEGQRVIVYDGACPTPVIAFGVKHLEAAGAIMLTASHNPFLYQGLKFIPFFAGPAMPESTDRITELIVELQPGFVAPPLVTDWDGETINLREAYFAALDKLVNPQALRGGGLNVLYTAMHGCGASYLDGYLTRAGVPVTTLAAGRDAYFGGSLPDPSPENLIPLAKQAKQDGFSVVIGTDGDADRFGIVDPDGRYFGANHVLPMLADYLIQAKDMRGALVRTVATSHLLDSAAREHGLELIETSVGFKYVGDELRRGALIGGEESGGISIQGHVPEKDGILATLLVLEMLADTHNKLDVLYDKTLERFGRREYRRIDIAMPDTGKQRLLNALREHNAALFGGHAIAKRNLQDGIKFEFGSGSWMLVRASGTEPLIRLYVEAVRPDRLEELARAFQDEIARLSGEPIQLAGH